MRPAGTKSWAGRLPAGIKATGFLPNRIIVFEYLNDAPPFSSAEFTWLVRIAPVVQSAMAHHWARITRISEPDLRKAEDRPPTDKARRGVEAWWSGCALAAAGSVLPAKHPYAMTNLQKTLDRTPKIKAELVCAAPRVSVSVGRESHQGNPEQGELIESGSAWDRARTGRGVSINC